MGNLLSNAQIKTILFHLMLLWLSSISYTVSMPICFVGLVAIVTHMKLAEYRKIKAGGLKLCRNVLCIHVYIFFKTFSNGILSQTTMPFVTKFHR